MRRIVHQIVGVDCVVMKKFQYAEHVVVDQYRKCECGAAAGQRGNRGARKIAIYGQIGNPDRLADW